MKELPRVFTRLDDLIKQKYGTVKNFSEKIFYDAATVTRKIKGKSFFTSGEIKVWCAALDIPRNEIPFYFFQDMEEES